MAMNPMQRKANNSFLLGILITLLITGIIIAFLIFQVMNLNKEIKDQEATLTKVYVLNEDVKSGQIITSDLLKTQEVFSTTVPENAIGDLEVLDTYYLADEQGNQAYTGYKVQDPSNILPDIQDSNNDGFKIISNADYDGLADTEKNSLTNVAATQYITRNNENCEITLDEETGKYYILVPESGHYTKEVLETMPLIAKIDMYKNTVVTPQMVSEGQVTSDDVRTQEYNVITLLSQLQTGDYIDIRLRMPNGQDFIVVSNKEVTIPQVLDVDTGTSIWMNLSEEETLMMSCAIVELYEMNGAKLYANKYVEPGIQDAATPTYIPNAETISLISKDPNIVQEAKQELVDRYNKDVRDGGDRVVRPAIDSETNNEDAKDNVVDKTQEEITSQKEEREAYIDSLGG